MGKEVIVYVLVAILCSAGIFAFLLLPDYISSKIMNQTNNQNTPPVTNNQQTTTPSNPTTPPIPETDPCTEIFRCGPGSNYIGNDETKEYFSCTCSSAKSIPDALISCFTSESEAQSMYYQLGSC